MRKIKLIADTFISGELLAVNSDPNKNILTLDDVVAAVLVAAAKAEYANDDVVAAVLVAAETVESEGEGHPVPPPCRKISKVGSRKTQKSRRR